MFRNPGKIEDIRLQFFKSEWFEDKEVLDIGCNIGDIELFHHFLFEKLYDS